MTQPLDSTEKRLFMFFVYLVLGLFGTATCIKDEDIPPMELTLLYRQLDNMNFRIKLEMDVAAVECEYIATDENDLKPLLGELMYWGLTPDGIIMFSTLKLITASGQNNLHNKFSPVPLSAQLKSISTASHHKTLIAAAGTKYLMQVVNQEDKILYNFIVIETREDSEHPTFVLQLHTNYTISDIRFPVKFFVKRYMESSRERVVMTQDNGTGRYKFEKFQGLKVYQWNKNVERLNVETVFAREADNKKYVVTSMGCITWNAGSVYCLEDDGEILDIYFEVEAMKDHCILSKSIEPLEESSEDKIYLNVFESDEIQPKHKLIQKITGRLVKDHEKRANFAYIFTVKEPRATILRELSTTECHLYAFTVSKEFRHCRYNPLDLMHIEHLGDDIYGVKASSFGAVEIQDCKLNEDPAIGPVLKAGKAQNTVFKLCGVPPEAEEYYSKTGQSFKLSGSGINPGIKIESERFEKMCNGLGNVYFALEAKHLSRPLNFNDNTRVLQIFFDDALKWSLDVDIFATLPKESHVLLIVPHNRMNRILPKAIAEHMPTSPQAFDLKIFKYDLQEMKTVLVESFSVDFVRHDTQQNTLQVKKKLTTGSSFALLSHSASHLFTALTLRTSSEGAQRG